MHGASGRRGSYRGRDENVAAAVDGEASASRPARQLGTLLLVVCLGWSAQVFPAVVQMPWPRQLGPTDGLPDPLVREIAEDATGYLWLAGSDGLMRFDGQRYRLWRHDEGLPDVDLRSVHVDARDRPGWARPPADW